MSEVGFGHPYALCTLLNQVTVRDDIHVFFNGLLGRLEGLMLGQYKAVRIVNEGIAA